MVTLRTLQADINGVQYSGITRKDWNIPKESHLKLFEEEEYSELQKYWLYNEMHLNGSKIGYIDLSGSKQLPWIATNPVAKEKEKYHGIWIF